MSCIYREVCDWDQYYKTYDQDFPGVEEAFLFVMNNSETVFTHITPDVKSTYYVTKQSSIINELYFSTIS